MLPIVSLLQAANKATSDVVPWGEGYYNELTAAGFDCPSAASHMVIPATSLLVDNMAYVCQDSESIHVSTENHSARNRPPDLATVPGPEHDSNVLSS